MVGQFPECFGRKVEKKEKGVCSTFFDVGKKEPRALSG